MQVCLEVIHYDVVLLEHKNLLTNCDFDWVLGHSEDFVQGELLVSQLKANKLNSIAFKSDTLKQFFLLILLENIFIDIKAVQICIDSTVG